MIEGFDGWDDDPIANGQTAGPRDLTVIGPPERLFIVPRSVVDLGDRRKGFPLPYGMPSRPSIHDSGT